MGRDYAAKVGRMLARLAEVESELGKPDIFNQRDVYRKLTAEYSDLNEIRQVWEKIQKTEKELAENRKIVETESDEELRALAQEEIPTLEKQLPVLKEKLDELLLPSDPNDDCNTIVELRAGTGGEEAALFVADCFRMYRLFAESQGWTVEVLSGSDSDVGGFKEIIFALTGKKVYQLMQYEAGTHRVQRVPATESQGRVHTSAITVAVLPEIKEEEEVPIDPKDLRIDTMRASGAGGQHVNTTDSAVRIVHIPTGTLVYCQQERSQIKNRDKAMRMLKAKLAEVDRLQKEKELSSKRLQQIGTGDRSERIRTYNYPQNRLTEHRINMTVYNLDRVMEGELGVISHALLRHDREKQWDA